MTQNDLRDATAASARLRFISGKPGKLSSPDYYDRQVLTELLENLGIEVPQEKIGA